MAEYVERICANLRGLCPGSSRPALRLVLALAGCAAVRTPAWADDVTRGELGLPFTRFYSFEEIGSASRGVRLGFDPLGRITVTRGGACLVLNDTTWINIADNEASNVTMQRLVFGPDGNAYFGSFGAWGIASFENGRLRPHLLTPATVPKWAGTMNVSDVVPLDTGTYFGGLNGVVYREQATGRHHFFEIPDTSRIFALGRKLYAVSQLQGLCSIELEKQTVQTVRGPGANGTEIDQVTPFDDSRVLLSDINGQLSFFDGTGFAPFPGPLGERTHGRVSSLLRLPDGNVAVAINGVGLYLVSGNGRILFALTTPEYQRVTDLAARENGMLWLVTENGVEKIIYDSPLTAFSQRLGLPVSWPQLVRWNNRVVVASGGRLYEAVSGAPGETTRFKLLPEQPAAAVWAIATTETQMLIGTNQGVLARNQAGGFDFVLPGFDAARLVRVNDVVYVLGVREIAALRQIDGRWAECAPRIPGLGYPLVTLGTNHAAWVELGPNRAARVRLSEGRLHARVFESFPWKEPRWVNVGFAGDVVALTGPPDRRVFFDERTETLAETHALQRMLERAPYPVTRFRQDPDGTIWGAHDLGLLTLRMRDNQVVVDASTYGRINDRFPSVQLLPDGDVWLSTGQSLYHVNRHTNPAGKPGFKPTLVSLVNGRTGRELLTRPGSVNSQLTLPYEENSLILRFFAGSYASRQPPGYEFRLHRGSDSRVAVGNGSLLTLTDLREGSYRLEARMTDSQAPVGTPFFLDFRITPPWFRTWYAFALYALGVATVVYGLIRWSVHHTYSKNVALEKLVAERTNELRAAMQQLNDETRNAATLAERDRLAGEIHDSLQQGLSGLMLQLDATLKLADLPDDIRSRLSVARNMVSFTRHEVQHAVWDMETPLLEGTELGEALKKITALIGPGATDVRITVSGQPLDLSSATKHHLLRIAQEAITNAVRHAAARTITITLAYEPSGVSLSVADDGNGFVPSEVLNHGIGHFGLRGLRGRAGKIGGELHIESAPGHGTTVRVTVQTSTPAFAHDS